MNSKIISAIIIFGLITVIPTVYGQLTIGSEAKQESIEVKINTNGEIKVKHIVSTSNMPSSLPLFTVIHLFFFARSSEKSIQQHTGGTSTLSYIFNNFHIGNCGVILIILIEIYILNLPFLVILFSFFVFI